MKLRDQVTRVFISDSARGLKGLLTKQDGARHMPPVWNPGAPYLPSIQCHTEPDPFLDPPLEGRARASGLSLWATNP
jgi:hypothetical protein